MEVADVRVRLWKVPRPVSFTTMPIFPIQEKVSLLHICGRQARRTIVEPGVEDAKGQENGSKLQRPYEKIFLPYNPYVG